MLTVMLDLLNSYRVFMLASKSTIKITIALILLMAAGIIYGIGRNTQATTSGYEAAHTEQLDDASVVSIIDSEDILNTPQLSPISGAVINDIYGKHYNQTGKIERQATYASSLKKVDDTSYAFTVVFLPSKTKYDVELTISSVENKSFSVEVQ